MFQWVTDIFDFSKLPRDPKGGFAPPKPWPDPPPLSYEGPKEAAESDGPPTADMEINICEQVGGYQPTDSGNLNPPPTGGSGVPSGKCPHCGK